MLPPTQRNLAGLEGTWVLELYWEGMYDNGDCELEFGTDNYSYTWLVETESIQKNTLEYSYDGSTLTVLSIYYDEDGGEGSHYIDDFKETYIIQIQPGAKSGTFEYQWEGSAYSDRCGKTLETSSNGTGTFTIN